MVLKNLSFIHSWNFNLTDILKLKNFHYDLVLFNKRQQNHKNKNICENLDKWFAKKCSFPHPLKAKNSHFPQTAVFEKSVPQQKGGGGHYESQKELT